jgi:hypothetical protein
MSVAIERKSGCLDILALHRYGEIENSKEVADFEAISACNRLSIAYFGFNQKFLQLSIPLSTAQVINRF